MRFLPALFITILAFLILGCTLLNEDKPNPEIPGKIVFSTNEIANGTQVYKMNTDGTRLKKLTSNGAFEPSWSPDGKKIVFTTPQKGVVGLPSIYIMNADGSNKRPMKINSSGFGLPYAGGNPVWSPDGSKIAFDTCVNCGGASGINYEIFVYDFTADSVTRLTNNYWIDKEPVWSPDGSKIAFTTETAYVDSGLSGFQDIYTLNLENRVLTRITETGNAVDPEWSPDGKYISYQTFIGEAKTYLFNTETNIHQVLFPEFKVSAGLEWSKNGSIMAIQIGLDGTVTQRTHYYKILNEQMELIHMQLLPYKQIRGVYDWYYDENE